MRILGGKIIPIESGGSIKFRITHTVIDDLNFDYPFRPEETIGSPEG
jgi:hypothetical protein